MIKIKKLQKAFTLIELLVVIAIIGILATLILTNIQGVRERARDLRRKSDLSSIQKALRLYYNDARGFPNNGSGFVIAGCGTIATPSNCSWGGGFVAGTTTYMQRLPYDPSSSTTTNITYKYYRNPTDSDQYILVTALENASDPEVTESQARCSAVYTAYKSAGGTSSTKDYVVCSE